MLQMWLAKTGDIGVGWAPIQCDWYPYKKTVTWGLRHRVNAADEAGRDWTDAATSQGMLEMAGKPPAARRGKEGSSSVFQRSLSLADTLISDS